MKGIIRKLFRPEGVIQTNTKIEFDEKGQVIDKKGENYTTVKYFGEVGKVDIAGILKEKKARTDFEGSADNITNTSLMDHRDKGANAILRKKNGAITEALIDCLS